MAGSPELHAVGGTARHGRNPSSREIAVALYSDHLDLAGIRKAANVPDRPPPPADASEGPPRPNAAERACARRRQRRRTALRRIAAIAAFSLCCLAVAPAA